MCIVRIPQIHDVNVYGHSNRISHEVSRIQERGAQGFSGQVRFFLFLKAHYYYYCALLKLRFVYFHSKNKIGTAWFRGVTPLKWQTWPYAIRLTKRTIAKSVTGLQHRSDGFRGRAFYW